MSRKPRSRQSQRLDVHASRDAADASPRRTGMALPLHRRDGLGRYEDALLGCPLRSSNRGHRIRVVCREANAGNVGDHYQNACKSLQKRSVARHGVRASPRRSRSVTFRSPPCVWDAVRRVRRSVSRVGERRRGRDARQKTCKSVENGCERHVERDPRGVADTARSEYTDYDGRSDTPEPLVSGIRAFIRVIRLIACLQRHHTLSPTPPPLLTLRAFSSLSSLSSVSSFSFFSPPPQPFSCLRRRR